MALIVLLEVLAVIQLRLSLLDKYKLMELFLIPIQLMDLFMEAKELVLD